MLIFRNGIYYCLKSNSKYFLTSLRILKLFPIKNIHYMCNVQQLSLTSNKYLQNICLNTAGNRLYLLRMNFIKTHFDFVCFYFQIFKKNGNLKQIKIKMNFVRSGESTFTFQYNKNNFFHLHSKCKVSTFKITSLCTMLYFFLLVLCVSVKRLVCIFPFPKST